MFYKCSLRRVLPAASEVRFRPSAINKLGRCTFYAYAMMPSSMNDVPISHGTNQVHRRVAGWWSNDLPVSTMVSYLGSESVVGCVLKSEVS